MRDPAPFTPADCDLDGLPYMPLKVRRMLESDFYALATPEEFRAGLTLWCRAFFQVPAGSLPNHEKLLAHLSGAGDRWSEVREMALHGWVKCSDGRLYHPVVAEVALEAWQSRRSNKERTQAARAARHRGSHTNGTGNVTPPVTAPPSDDVTFSVTESAAQAVTSSKGREGKRREEKGTKERPLTTFAPPAEAGFDEFWRVYPRKDDKGHARKAFAKALKKTSLVDILAALERQNLKARGQMCPYPATWLNGERWTDEGAPPDQGTLETLREDWGLGSFLVPTTEKLQ